MGSPESQGLVPSRWSRGGSIALSVIVLLFTALLSWVWRKTQSVNPEDHRRIDAALRELRSLDRTINQDVVRARYKLTQNYDLVLQSYRRVNELERDIAKPPRFLNAAARERFVSAVREYASAVTHKQRLIETAKYRMSELNELLDYLPGAGVELGQALSARADPALAESVHHLLEVVLLYNLTSDEHLAPAIAAQIQGLSQDAARVGSPALHRRVRTLLLNVQRLLRVKPEVNDLLLKMFDEPIVDHENAVARAYYGPYLAAEKTAKTYRLVLYVLCVGLAALIAYAVHRLRQTARTLEEHVVERTRDLRAVLDNVEEALLTVTADGRLKGDPSAAFVRWFPDARAGDHLWEVLRPLDPEASAWLALGWDQLGEEMLPLDVALDQLPASFSAGAGRRHYRIGYRPMGNAARPELFLVVISDVTSEVERRRREADQQDHLMLFQQVMVDGAQFEESFAEMERLVRRILDRDHPDRYSLARTLHTIKGNAGMYGLSSLTNVCHEIESRMDDGQRDPTVDELDQLRETWEPLAGRVRALLRLTQSDRLAITKTDLAQLRQAVSADRAPGDLLYALTYLEREPVARRFERFGEQARHIAARLGKGDIVVETDAEGLRLDARRWTAFWASFVHLLRNALDHGLETPDERRHAGKSGPGHLKLLARDCGGQILIEVTDDGRGIDWDAVRAKAQKRGLRASTTADLTTALLEGGLSTKREATLYSGRGAGLSASYRACCELGGQMTITSVLGRGTTFRLLIPGDDGAVLPLDPAELRAAR